MLFMGWENNTHPEQAWITLVDIMILTKILTLVVIYKALKKATTKNMLIKVNKLQQRIEITEKNTLKKEDNPF